LGSFFEVKIERFLGFNEYFFSFRVNFRDNLFNCKVILSLVRGLNNDLKLNKLLVLKVEVIGLSHLLKDIRVVQPFIFVL